jgi:flagellin
MSQIINTNIASLNAQRNLTQSSSSLNTSLERLSTGLRINSAKDDAAGLAISERFTSQIRGLNQAVRNANDGISFAQTAEGALSTIGDNLQRARELAVQAANDSNSAGDRQALDDEVQQLLAEVSRVANNTQFNGGNILDGSQDDLFFQVGANQGQTIAVSGVDSRTSQLGNNEVETPGGFSQAQVEDENELLNFSAAADITIDTDAGLTSAITVDITSATSVDDVVRLVNTEIDRRAALGNADALAISSAGFEASLRIDNDGFTDIVIGASFDTEGFTVAGGTNITADTASGTGSATTVNLWAGTTSATQYSLDDVNVTTRRDAGQALGIIDGALNQVNSLRAELGAVQVRFENTITNLGVGSENLSAARSRILDADFAAETANLARAQILQQAGISVLTQANAQPQNVLSLLQ